MGKGKFFSILLGLLAVAAFLPVQSTAFGSQALNDGNGLIYRLINNDNEYEVVCDTNFAGLTFADIPSEKNGIPVSSIAKNAFLEHPTLEKVKIPESIRYIGEEAFSGCESLSEVIFHAVECESLVRPGTFSGSKEGMTVTFGDSVQAIPDYLFAGADNLVSAEFEPNSPVRIGDKAFEDSGLSQANVPVEVVDIGAYAFSGTPFLIDLIADSTENEVTYLNNVAVLFDSDKISVDFRVGTKGISTATVNEYSATELSGIKQNAVQNVTIPSGVEVISNAAFIYSRYLTTINFENTTSIKKIGEGVFNGTQWYLDMKNGNYATYHFRETPYVRFGTNYEICLSFNPGFVYEKITVGNHPENDLSGVRIIIECPVDVSTITFNMPDSVEYVSPGAFKSDKQLALREVNLSKNLKRIEAGTFLNCKSVTVRTEVEDIRLCREALSGSFAIEFLSESVRVQCESKALFGVRVIYVKQTAYNLCKKNIYSFADNVSYASNLFMSNNLPDDGFLILGDELLTYIGNETELVLPAVKRIGDYAFYNDAEIRKITISKETESIGVAAFRSTSVLTEVAFESGSKCREIAEYAFADAVRLARCSFPDSIQSIGKHAFDGCIILHTLVPTSLTQRNVLAVDEYAFRNANIVELEGGLNQIAGGGFSIHNTIVSGANIILVRDEYKSAYGNFLVEIGDAGRLLGDSDVDENNLLVYDRTCYGYRYPYQKNARHEIKITGNITSIADSAFFMRDDIVQLDILPKNGVSESTVVEYSAFYGLSGIEKMFVRRGILVKIASNTVPNFDSFVNFGVEGGAVFYTNKADMNHYASSQSDWTSFPLNVKEMIIEPYEQNVTFGVVSNCHFTRWNSFPPIIRLIADYVCAINNRQNYLDSQKFPSTTYFVVPSNLYQDYVDEYQDMGYRFIDESTLIGEYIIENGVLKSFIGTGTVAELPQEATSIAANAFSGSNIKTIKLNKELKTLDDSAFEGCNALENIVVDNQNPYFASVDGVLFSKDKTVLLVYPHGRAALSYQVPMGTVQVAARAFADATKLMRVSLPKSVKTVQSQAFFGCDNLTKLDAEFFSVYFEPNALLACGLGTLGEYGVIYYDGYIIGYDSTQLGDTITINQTKGILSNAFADAIGLKRITLPDGIAFIGAKAFKGCIELRNINFPNTLASIGAQVFNDTLLYAANPNSYAVIIDKWVVGVSGTGQVAINTEIYGISDEAFVIRGTDGEINTAATAAISFGAKTTSSLKVIGKNAFFGTSLWNLTSGVVYYGNWAVGYNGESPNTITLVEGTVGIAGGCFENLSTLSQITIGGARYIGIDAFFNTQLYNQADGLIVADSAVLGYNGTSASVVIDSAFTAIAAFAFYNTQLRIIEIGENVVEIGAGAFCDTDVAVHLLKVYSEQYALRGFNEDQMIFSAAYATHTERYPWLRFISAEKLVDRVYYIDGNTLLQYFGESDRVMLPLTVTAIDMNAFSKYDSIESLLLPYNDGIIIALGSGLNTTVDIIYVASKLVEQYKSTADWNGFSSKILPAPSKYDPVVFDIQAGGFYNTDVSVVYDYVADAMCSIDGEAEFDIQSGAVFGADGKYLITIIGYFGKVLEVTFTLDKTSPIINLSGLVGGNEYYIPTINFEDSLSDVASATLNGKPIANGTVIKGQSYPDGEYTLVITDKAGNTETANFVLNNTPILSYSSGFVYVAFTGEIWVSCENLYLEIANCTGAQLYRDSISVMLTNNRAAFFNISEAEYTFVLRGDAEVEVTYRIHVINKLPQIVLSMDITEGQRIKSTISIDGIFGEIESITITQDGEQIEYTKGMKLKRNGEYTIRVVDKAGQVVSLNFTIKKSLSAGYIWASIGIAVFVTVVIAIVGAMMRKKRVRM